MGQSCSKSESTQVRDVSAMLTPDPITEESEDWSKVKTPTNNGRTHVIRVEVQTAKNGDVMKEGAKNTTEAASHDDVNDDDVVKSRLQAKDELLTTIPTEKLDEFTKEELEAHTLLFLILKDQACLVTGDHVTELFSGCSYNVTHCIPEARKSKWIAEYADGLDFRTFLDLMIESRGAEEEEEEEELMAAFRSFDRGNKGHLDLEDIKHLMTSLGEDPSVDATEMLTESDLDKDGVLNFKEFLNVMKGKG